MFKFSTDRRKYDLSKYKNLPIFHDIFEWVWSGHYGECFDLTFHFDSADKENDKIIVNVNFDN